MKWFYNLKISVKLLAGFIVVALIAGVIGLMGVLNINKVNRLDTKLYEKMTSPLGELVGLTEKYEGMRASLRDVIISTSITDMAKYEKSFKNDSLEFDKKLAVFEKTLLTEQGNQLVSDLRAAKQSYVDNANKIISKTKANDPKGAISVLRGDGVTAAEDVDKAMQSVKEIKLQLAKEASDYNNETAKSSTMFTLVLMLFGILVAISFGIFISRIISGPVKKLSEAADKLALGDVDVNVKADTKDEIGSLMVSFEKMIANIRIQAEEANKIAIGDLKVEVKVNSDKDILSKSLKQVTETLRCLIGEMDHMSMEHDEGDIDVFVEEEKFDGAYKTMAQGVNNMVKGHLAVNKKAMGCIAEFSKGNFNAELEKFPGKKAFINDNIEAMRKNLKDVNSEIRKLIIASNEGKLNERADIKAFDGDWAELMKGLNGLIDAIIEPVQEASAVLEEMSKGNLQTSVKGDYKGDHAKIKNALNDSISTLSSYVSEISETLTQMANGNLDVVINRDYRGDFAEIKNSLNNIINSFNDVLNDISNSASQVASGSRQVSDSAQALSQGSTEQASSIEELTASMEEIAAQTKQNAANANQANELAVSAKVDAENGNNQMKGMLRAMDEINEASANIYKIIKVIDEIAFQTNILALNAAVEAARAGQHGKGFAVVAEEVRNLAARSANAAKETTVLIEGSMKKVEGGTNIANDTALALNKIVDVVAKAASLVGEIAAASNEQATGITQVNQGIMQVSSVTQTNSATSEESAAASEELSSQAELLNEMVGKFRLKKSSSNMYSKLEGINPEVLKIIENLPAKKGKTSSKGTQQGSGKRISLGEVDFGKY